MSATVAAALGTQESSAVQAQRWLAEFAAGDGSAARVAAAVAADRSLTYQETVDFQKTPGTYVPTLAALLDLGVLAGPPPTVSPPSRPTEPLRLLHLGASHGVFCRFLQTLPWIGTALALDLSRPALRYGCAWGLRAAVAADAVSLAACRRGWADVVLAESLYVPGYWRAAAIARSIAAVARVVRPGGLLLVQEWGFDVARQFRSELTDAGLREVHRVTAPAPTQQGEREVTCFVFRAPEDGRG